MCRCVEGVCVQVYVWVWMCVHVRYIQQSLWKWEMCAVCAWTGGEVCVRDNIYTHGEWHAYSKHIHVINHLSRDLSHTTGENCFVATYNGSSGQYPSIEQEISGPARSTKLCIR